MKLDQLRKIIREEVRAAVKEELQEVMNEAVKIASTPNAMQKAPQPKDSNLKWSVPSTGKKSLDEMLAATKATMTSDEYKTIINANSTAVQAPSFAQRSASQLSGAGLDLSTIPGLDLSRSKAILDAANKKDKQRAGL